MNPFSMILVAAMTFGLCFLFDKGYTRLFRNKAQHRTGLQVRPSKRYGSFGLVLCILGIVAVLAGFGGESALLIGGAVVIFIGCILAGYYISYGIYCCSDIKYALIGDNVVCTCLKCILHYLILVNILTVNKNNALTGEHKHN